ncbi:MAG: spermidine/putrescine ABC transporter substrate-binding protein [Lachnospiraceae bacterium]|nr:spermidine/putrescine ABC transporter substrate-binding protein [Lachnospiraceae bacterium]
MKKRNMGRKFLSVTLLATLCMTLAGCGSKTGSTETGSSINVFIWTEYVSDAAIEAFEEESGIKVNVSTYSSNEDLMAKLKSETEGTYDVILPSDYAVEYLISQDKLMELDKDKLTNLSNISSAYLDPSYDPGNVYSVPYEGGVACIAVNTSKVDMEITSYDDLFNPSLEGQIVVLDDYRAVIGMTERSMGLSMNESDADKLAEVEEKLLTLKDNIKLYDSDSPKSALISGDCSVGMIWSAEVALSMEENPDIEIVYPKEGAYVFMDNWAIPTGSTHYDEAMEFINFMLSAEAAQMNVSDFPYLCPNEAGLELMGEEYVANTAKNVPSEVIENGEFISNLDTDTMAIYDEMWTKLKE